MDDNKIRLDSLLRSRGAATRKQLRELSARGLVTVNEQAVYDPSVRVLPTDIIAISGRVIEPAEPLTIMLNKPAGYSSVGGESVHPTVFTLLPEEFSDKALFCIGRLDAATEGLLLLTNDGSLCERIIRPESGIAKKYLVQTDRPLCENAAVLLSAGVVFPNGDRCRPAVLEQLSADSYLITVTEGKYHEVRRLVRFCGAMTSRLSRLSIGALCLDPALPQGSCRRLSGSEIESIFSPVDPAYPVL